MSDDLASKSQMNGSTSMHKKGIVGTLAKKDKIMELTDNDDMLTQLVKGKGKNGKGKPKGQKQYRVKDRKAEDEYERNGNEGGAWRKGDGKKKGKKGVHEPDHHNHWFLGKGEGNSKGAWWNPSWDRSPSIANNGQKWKGNVWELPSWSSSKEYRIKSRDCSKEESGTVASIVTHCWVDIPWWSRGMLIGRNGEKLQEIRESSKVQRGYLPPDTYGIYLKGTPDQVLAAEAEFYRLLKALKSEISMREGHGGMYEFETLVCPALWPIEKLFDGSCVDAEVQMIRRWKSEVVDGIGEPAWDTEVLMDESVICIRAAREQMPNVLLSLNPRTEMAIVVPDVMHEYLLKEKANFLHSIETQPGVAEWVNEGDASNILRRASDSTLSDCDSKILRGRGVDRVMHDVASAIFNFIRDARSTEGDFRVVDLAVDVMHLMGQKSIEETVRKMEGATGAVAHWVKKRWCYGGDSWLIDESDNSGAGLLIITGATHAIVIMEQRLLAHLNSLRLKMVLQNGSFAACQADGQPVVLQIDGRTNSQYQDASGTYVSPSAHQAALQAPSLQSPYQTFQKQQSPVGLNRYALPFTPQGNDAHFGDFSRSPLPVTPGPLHGQQDMLSVPPGMWDYGKTTPVNFPDRRMCADNAPWFTLHEGSAKHVQDEPEDITYQ